MATPNVVDSTGNSLLDIVLQYGLFIGAIFQIVCIFAVVLIPQNEEEQEEESDDEQQVSAPSSKSLDTGVSRNKRTEKKKRR